MQPRWHDWAIALSIVALVVIGVTTIWGGDIRRLWRGESQPEPAADPGVTPPSPSGAL